MAGLAGVVTSGKMTHGQYIYLHVWVAKKLGKPMWCWNCKDNTKSKYVWANKSGEYQKNIFDWERLCYTCHQAKDQYGYVEVEYCKHGHKMEGSNLYLKPDGKRECKTCKRNYHKNARERKG